MMILLKFLYIKNFFIVWIIIGFFCNDKNCLGNGIFFILELILFVNIFV